MSKLTTYTAYKMGYIKFVGVGYEQINEGARANMPGFKVIRKLLADKRFDR